MNCRAAPNSAGCGHLAPGLVPGVFFQKLPVVLPAHRYHHGHHVRQAVTRRQYLGPCPRPSYIHRVPTVPEVVPRPDPTRLAPTRPDQGPRFEARLPPTLGPRTPTRPDLGAWTPTRPDLGPRTLVLEKLNK